MLDDYSKFVLTQFIEAKGIKKVDDSKQFTKDFLYWVKERAKSGDAFLSYVNSTGFFKYRRFDIAEVGKGYLDSIALNSDVPLITPHTHKIEDSKIIIPKSFVAAEAGHDEKDTQDSEQQIILREKNIEGFITHNPYDTKCLLNWSYLHNSCNGSIAVSAFGDIHDKDIQKKIKMLEKFRDRLNFGTYTEEYFEDGDNYYYNLVSNKRVRYKDMYKELIRRLH